MPQEYQHLRVRLRIEQTRLLRWSQKVDLVEERLEWPSRILLLNRNLIVDVLLCVQAAFRDCVDIQRQYDHLVAGGPRMMTEERQRLGGVKKEEEEEEEEGDDGFDNRFPEETSGLLKKALGFAQRVPQMPKRLKWAALKKKEFGGLVEKLIGYNDAIEGLLDSSAVEQLQFMQQQTYMAMLQLNSNVAELQQISKALQVNTQATDFNNGQMPPAYAPYQYAAAKKDDQANFARMADFQAEKIKLESQPSQMVPLRASEVNIVPDPSASPSGIRSVGRYRSQPVWIEWKRYDVQIDSYPNWSATIEDRIKKLATLLGFQNKPGQCGAPQCLGYFDDSANERYGLVYQTPGNVAQNARPMALLSLIRNQDLPSLTKRITLAHVIARCLLFLHSVDWLHKGLRSENIIFFDPSDDSKVFNAPIIGGFEYARPDWPEEITDPPRAHEEHDVYRHPSLLRGTFMRSRKSYDIYSLGVVLIEIACWKSINEIVDMPSSGKEAKSKVKKVREMLLTGPYLKTIEGLVGEVYAMCVRRCLAGGQGLGIADDADESNKEVGARMQTVFAEEVVRKLGNIKV